MALRQSAEARFAAQPVSTTATQQALMPLAAQHWLHESEVHQIELEMKNDKLRQAQEALDTSHAHYFDFYDVAPLGYQSVDANGLIGQANLTTATLLGP